jgi:hypothetical protein
MKTNKIFIIALLISSFFISCTKTIQIDIKDADKKIVIDAEIGNHSKQCAVKISKTINYTSANTFLGISGASVSISDQLGHAFTLTETSVGVYTNDTVVGVPGNTYFLQIVAEGKTFTSECKMPAVIAIDSINNSIENLFNTNVKIVRASFSDNGSEKNYYRYFKTANGVRRGESEVIDDNFFNGIATAVRFGSLNAGPGASDSMAFVSGTIFGVTLQHVDKSVYLYFNSKAQNTNGQSAAPANPESNIVGGALGFFNAYTSDYKETIMK